MEDVVDVASYVAHKIKACNAKIKVQQLLYFIQRESVIQTGSFLFEDPLFVYKFGVSCRRIRHLDRYSKSYTLSNESKCLIDGVLAKYKDKSIYSLFSIIREESSYRVHNTDRSNPIQLNDLQVDAQRIKKRREFLTRCRANPSRHAKVIIVDESDLIFEQKIDVKKELEKIRRYMKS